MVRFSRKNRLLTQQDFQFVWDKAQKITFKYGWVFFRPNQHKWGRIGIVVRKASLKLACERNLLRRLIRESFRSYLPKLSGFDVIVLLSLRKISIDKKIIKEGFDNLWPKILVNYSKLG